jgi:hypothetical protein
VLEVSRRAAQRDIQHLHVETKSLSIWDFSEIGVEVVDGVVGEVSDEGSGDDQRAASQADTGQQNSDSEHQIYYLIIGHRVYIGSMVYRLHS